MGSVPPCRAAWDSRVARTGCVGSNGTCCGLGGDWLSPACVPPVGSRALAAAHTGRASLSGCPSVTRSGSEFSAGNVTDLSSLALVRLSKHKHSRLLMWSVPCP